jgi:tetratricopeptide (TPR) repeat protein
MGAAYNQAHDSSRALEVLNRALEMARTSGEQDLEAGALSGIGRAFANLGDRSKALASYNSALSEYQETGNDEANSEVLRNIATLSASKNR